MPGQTAETSALLKRAREYHHYVATVRIVHYRMGDLQLRLNQVFGGLTVLSAAALSTGILSNADSNPSRSLTIAGGILAFFAAVLAGLQSFYKFGEVAEKHRTAGANYGDVRMKLELFLIQYASGEPADPAAAVDALEAIQTEISNLDKTGPGFPSRRYRLVERQQARTSREGSTGLADRRVLWPSKVPAAAAGDRHEPAGEPAAPAVPPPADPGPA